MKLYAALMSAVACCTLATAATFSPPPPLDPAQIPALIYSESQIGKPEINLYITHKEGAEWKRETLVSAPFIALEQMDETKFLLAAGPTEQNAELYAVDLLGGTSILLTKRKGHCPLSFPRPNERYHLWRENQMAFLIQNEDGAKDIEFITVNYADMTFQTALIPKETFGGFNDQTRMKIGPNGAHLAFVTPVALPTETPNTNFDILKIYHFSDKSVTVLAPKLTVQRSPKATGPMGWPAFDWVDWELVAFADTDPEKSAPDANVTFFTNNVHQEETTPYMSFRLPLTEEGGSLFRQSPQTPLILYRPGGASKEEFYLDFEKKAINPYQNTDRLRFVKEKDDVQVGTATRLLFHAKHFAGQALDCTSLKKLNFAYALSTAPEMEDKDRKAELFVNVGEADAEKVTGPTYYLRPLAWIE